MTDGVNIYELLHSFWRENEYEPFSTAEIALYFYLIDRANTRRWQMPVKCPTTTVCSSIKVSRQTLVTARESLARRGLIIYSKGSGNSEAPSYTVVTNPKDWTDSVTNNLTVGLTDDLTDRLTNNLTNGLTDNLTIYNMKDENIKDKISFNYNAAEKILSPKILSLDELERMLLADTCWHSSILSLLSKENLQKEKIADIDIPGQLRLFFENLRCQGMKEREEKECRAHFVNRIKKQLKYKVNGTDKQQLPDKRRSSGVTASSARDYDGAF